MTQLLPDFMLPFQGDRWVYKFHPQGVAVGLEYIGPSARNALERAGDESKKCFSAL
jgi:hypothetical protein